MRVGIVNDLAVACEALRRAVVGDPALSVAWTAHDGLQAVECARRDRPDVILMDLIMPRMNGVEATRAIMRESPCPILVVTATVSGNAALVYEALGAGALDAVNTPTFGSGAQLEGAADMLRRIHRIARSEVGAAAAPRSISARPVPSPRVRAESPRMLAIGASTGGPRATADLLRGLSRPLAMSVLVVQHVSPAFVRGYAEWLATETALPVELARSGERPVAGRVLVAGEDRHMVLDAAGRIAFRDEPSNVLHRPAVDELFISLAEHGDPGVAVLLTGMGRDGADGLLALRRAGWHTIAQDEASSVVWGMPGAAQRIGAAAEVLPIARIAESIAAGR